MVRDIIEGPELRSLGLCNEQKVPVRRSGKTSTRCPLNQLAAISARLGSSDLSVMVHFVWLAPRRRKLGEISAFSFVIGQRPTYSTLFDSVQSVILYRKTCLAVCRLRTVPR